MSPEENSFHMCRSSIWGAFQSQQNVPAPSVFNMQSPLPAGRIFVSESATSASLPTKQLIQIQNIYTVLPISGRTKAKGLRVCHPISITVLSGEINGFFRGIADISDTSNHIRTQTSSQLYIPNSIDIFRSKEKKIRKSIFLKILVLVN